MDNELPVVVQISNLYHYPYQRLAIRLRGAPRHARLRVVGMELRAFRQTFIAQAMNPCPICTTTKIWKRSEPPEL